jgi:hypothetical protein
MGEGGSGAEIPFELICAGCGYDLRGLTVAGRCPECGKPCWETVDEYARRAGRGRWVEMRRLTRQPAAVVRGIREGSGYAIAANVLAIAIALSPESWHRLRTPTRVALLAALCTAMALAAMSAWKWANAVALEGGAGGRWAKARRWGMRLGAVAAVAFVVTYTVGADWETFDRWVHFDVGHGPMGRVLFAFANLGLVGAILRLAEMQWWTRVEGRPLLAWPLVATVAPLACLLFPLALSGPPQLHYDRFNGFNTFLYVPLITNAWPGVLAEITRSLRWRSDVFQTGLVVVAWLGQAIVLAGDAWLVYVSSQELARRKGEVG